jgi:hypothetical protein
MNDARDGDRTRVRRVWTSREDGRGVKEENPSARGGRPNVGKRDRSSVDHAHARRRVRNRMQHRARKIPHARGMRDAVTTVTLLRYFVQEY